MAANPGDTVRVHYTGTLTDGSEFDSSRDRAPLEFKLGEGQVIPGFEEAVAGMEVGDQTKVTIPAEQAYGEPSDEARQTFPVDAFPQTPEVGWMVELQAPDGSVVPATVIEVTEQEATLDFNHPLAGEDLTFEIELVEVVG